MKRKTHLQPQPWLVCGLITGGAILLAAPAALAGVITPSPAFDPINVIQGQKSTYTLTLGNDDIQEAAGLAFTVNLPPGVKLSGTPKLGTTCNGPTGTTGTLNAAANGTTFGITGGTIPGRVGSTDGKCEIKLEMVGTGGGNQVVSLPVGAITSTPGITNSQEGKATLQVIGLNPVTTNVTFNPSPLPQGLSSLFTIKFGNGNSIPLTGVNFPFINLPTGLKIAPGASTNVCGGNLLAVAGSLGFDLKNATIAPGGCEISFYWEADGPITGSKQDFNFTFPDGTIVSDNNVSNTAGAGTLTVLKDLRVKHQFDRADVYINEASTMTVSFENASLANLTASGLTMTLPGGLKIADATTATTCGGTVTAVAGTDTFTFANGTIPGATLATLGKCDIKVNVSSATVNTYNNTINIGQVTNTQNSANINADTAQLIVQDITDIGLGIGTGVRFVQPVVSANNVSRMAIDIYNGTGLDLTGVGTNAGGIQLPTGLVLAGTGNPTTNCPAGTATTTGTDVINLAGASMGRRGFCSVEVDVISQTPFVYNQQVLANAFKSDQNRSNSASNGALDVIDFLNLEQSFDANTIAASAAGNVTKMKLKLINSANAISANTKLKFPLALGLKLVGGPATKNTCGGTLVLNANGTDFDLSNASIPAKTGPALGQDGFCEVEFDVLAAGAPGVINQNIPANSLSNATQFNRKPYDTPLTLADVRVLLNQQILNRTPGDPNSGRPIVKGGEPAELIVTLTNQSGINLTNVGFPNTLGAGMIVYPDPTTSSDCAGTPTFTAVPGDNKYSVAGINLAAGASCNVKLLITSLVKGNTLNNIVAKAITSTQGGTNPDPSDTTLTVEGNATMNKKFEPASIAAGTNSRLTISVINANNINLTGAEVLDALPAGIIVADIPNVDNKCTGTVTAPSGGTAVKLAGATLANNSICTFAVDVTSLTGGAYTNKLPAGTLKTAEAYTNDREITAVLNVTGNVIRPGLKLVKRITQITNPNGTATPEIIDLSARVENFTPPTGRDDDNAANWPTPIDNASGISSFLKGIHNSTQVAEQGRLQIGSTIEYSGYFLSDGNGPAKVAKLCDFLPAKTEFVTGSIVAKLGDGTALTGQFLPAGSPFPTACKGTDNGNGAVVIDLGNVVNSTAVGTPTTSFGSFKFKAKVK
jgi:uncharacterized repeat protein (TIGR01451 family)